MRASHFDHLDLAAVHELRNSVRWFVPLGVKPWFVEEGVTNVTELEYVQRRTPPSSNPNN